MIEGMQTNMFQANGGNQFNPLGHVSPAMGASPAPAVAPPITNASPPTASGTTGAMGSGELSLDSLRAALVSVDAHSDVEVKRACLSTVAKLGGNIVEHSEDVKYRRIKASNGAFVKKVVACNGGVELVRPGSGSTAAATLTSSLQPHVVPLPAPSSPTSPTPAPRPPPPLPGALELPHSAPSLTLALPSPWPYPHPGLILTLALPSPWPYPHRRCLRLASSLRRSMVSSTGGGTQPQQLPRPPSRPCAISSCKWQ